MKTAHTAARHAKKPAGRKIQNMKPEPEQKKTPKPGLLTQHIVDGPKIVMGRPPLPDEDRAESQIHLRVTRKRKAAYVRAARPGTLAAWMFKVCDDASGYKEPVEKQ